MRATRLMQAALVEGGDTARPEDGSQQKFDVLNVTYENARNDHCLRVVGEVANEYCGDRTMLVVYHRLSR